MRQERKWLIAIGTHYVAGLGRTYEGICSGKHISVTHGIVITRLVNRAMTFTSRREATPLAKSIGGQVQRCQGKEKSRPGGTGTAPEQNNHDNSTERSEKMQDLPDAPWIREAETYGMPPYDPEPKCPICYSECETLFRQYNGTTRTKGDVLGCEHCVTTENAWDYRAEHEEE